MERSFGLEVAAVAVAVDQSHLTGTVRALVKLVVRAGVEMVALVVAVAVVQVLVKLVGQTVLQAAVGGPMEIGIARDWAGHVIRIGAAGAVVGIEGCSGKAVEMPYNLVGHHIVGFARGTLCSAERLNSEILDLASHFGADFVAAETGN